MFMFVDFSIIFFNVQSNSSNYLCSSIANIVDFAFTLEFREATRLLLYLKNRRYSSVRIRGKRPM